MKMPIVLDLEFSGLDMEKCGIWQIGAYDLNTGEEFFEESRIDDEDLVEQGALKVVGKTEEDLRNPEKQSQKDMIQKFMEWIATRELRNFLCQNPQADVSFLNLRTAKYGIAKTFNYRAYDMHTIAQMKYFQLNGKFLTEEQHSKMGLPRIIGFCGMKDNRLKMEGNKIAEEGNPHNALEDAKLTAECFYRLVLGEKLLDEYSQYEIPEELKNA